MVQLTFVEGDTRGGQEKTLCFRGQQGSTDLERRRSQPSVKAGVGVGGSEG